MKDVPFSEDIADDRLSSEIYDFEVYHSKIIQYNTGMDIPGNHPQAFESVKYFPHHQPCA